MKTCVNKNVKYYDKVINFLLLIFQSEQCIFFNDLVIYVQNQIGECLENNKKNFFNKIACSLLFHMCTCRKHHCILINY